MPHRRQLAEATQREASPPGRCIFFRKFQVGQSFDQRGEHQLGLEARKLGAETEVLHGASIADAFYAPVAARLRSYRVALPPVAAAYVDSLYQWPAFQRWYRAALQEVQG